MRDYIEPRLGDGPGSRDGTDPRTLRAMENILVPALVAAMVSLLMEYAAKPRLEARKERILESHRVVRELDRSIGVLLVELAKMRRSTMLWDSAPQQAVAFAREAISQAKKVESHGIPAGESIPREIPVLLMTALGGVTGSLSASIEQPESFASRLQMLEACTEAVTVVHAFVRSPWWRLGQRVQLRATARTLLRSPSFSPSAATP